MRMIYTAILTPNEDGSGYHADVPDVPDCSVVGENLRETIDRIRDNLCSRLCALEDADQALPAARLPGAFTPPLGASCVLVDVDTLKYRMLTDTRAVRKNVSLPAWMAHLADQRDVNCSQVLQDALRKLLCAV